MIETVLGVTLGMSLIMNLLLAGVINEIGPKMYRAIKLRDGRLIHVIESTTKPGVLFIYYPGNHKWVKLDD